MHFRVTYVVPVRYLYDPYESIIHRTDALEGHLYFVPVGAREGVYQLSATDDDNYI